MSPRNWVASELFGAVNTLFTMCSLTASIRYPGIGLSIWIGRSA